jgi:hypothetical protein
MPNLFFYCRGVDHDPDEVQDSYRASLWAAFFFLLLYLFVLGAGIWGIIHFYKKYMA